MIEKIKSDLLSTIKSATIEIEDTSNVHAGHYEKDNLSVPSHLTVKIVSNYFEGMSLVQRHRIVNKTMSPYFDKGLHALQIIAKTEREQVR